MARRIAEAFGGELHATSEPAKGSCFMLRLPRIKQEKLSQAAELVAVTIPSG